MIAGHRETVDKRQQVLAMVRSDVPNPVNLWKTLASQTKCGNSRKVLISDGHRRGEQPPEKSACVAGLAIIRPAGS